MRVKEAEVIIPILSLGGFQRGLAPFGTRFCVAKSSVLCLRGRDGQIDEYICELLIEGHV